MCGSLHRPTTSVGHILMSTTTSINSVAVPATLAFVVKQLESGVHVKQIVIPTE